MTSSNLIEAEEIARAIEAFQNQHIVVIGDVMLDCYIHGDVERISPEAPIPILKQKNVKSVPGGAANVARNLVHLGCQVTLIGVTGQDSQAKQLQEALDPLPQLTFENIIAEDRPTTTKTRFMSAGQQMLRLDDELSHPILPTLEKRIRDCAEKKLQDAHILILSDYAKGVLTPDLLQNLIALASGRNIPVVIDPKLTAFDAYAGASLLTPNLLELQRAAGENLYQIDEIIQFSRTVLHQNHIDKMLVTLGARGMLIITPETSSHLPAHKCDVYDVSGAGDTVISTLAACLSCSSDLEHAAYIGNLAASLVVAKLGTACLSPGELIAAGQHDFPDLHLSAALLEIAQWRKEGLRIGFTNGCFDLLHAGHLHILRSAASQCDKLIVGLNSDDSVRRLKGDSRPIQTETTRASVLAALPFVDTVLMFDTDTPLELINAILPDLLVKGGDYTEKDVVGYETVQANAGQTLIIPLLDDYSTTSFLASE